MNKKFIALAVAALASGAANAAAIYQNDTTTFGISGEIDSYLSKLNASPSNSSVSSADTDVDLWAKIQIDAQHKINDDVSVFGSFEIENGSGYDGWNWSSNDDKKVVTDDLYFGANLGDSWGVAVGEIGDFGDSFDAITIDNTNEGVGYMDDFVTSFETKGHAASVKYDANGLVLIADTYLSQEANLDNAYGVSASYTINGFNVGASYQDHGNRDGYATASTNGGDNDVYGVKVGYTGDAFSVASNYVVETKDGVDTNVVGLAADYKIGATRLYTSGFIADKDETSTDFSGYTLGADYAFTKNVLAFAEYTNTDNLENVDKADAELYVGLI